jgi:glycosyltransferase involved in cell wall biosynthesis
LNTAGVVRANPLTTETITSHALPTISVIIPVRNEEEYISRCLQSLFGQDYPEELFEVIVVDGGSIDNSVKIVRKVAEEHSNIKLLGGPGINCPAAMNIGITNATGELISKIDGHGYVASDYLRMSAKYISTKGEIKCVGGPIRSAAKAIVAEANAIARSSVFGVGKGAYSMGKETQFVDSVQCGTYEKTIFEEVGLFDESLQFGEDEEVNWRIRKRGYKVFSTPDIRFFYFPRKSFGKLFRQYYNYGRARVKVIQRHPDFFRIKHIIPTAFVATIFAAGILGIYSQFFSQLFVGSAIAYLIVSLGFSAVISSKRGWKLFGLLPISFAALHFGYGIGFAQGVCRLCSMKMSRKWKGN